MAKRGRKGEESRGGRERSRGDGSRDCKEWRRERRAGVV